MSLEPCPHCRAGRVACAHCGGLGDAQCEACAGSGKQACPDCGGRAVASDGAACECCRWGVVDCAACGGSGRVPCDNRRCRHGTVTCPSCGGVLPGDPVGAAPALGATGPHRRLAAPTYGATGEMPAVGAPAPGAGSSLRRARPAARGTARWLWVAPVAMAALALGYLALPSPQPEPWRAAVATSQARAALGPSPSPSPVAAPGPGATVWEPPAKPTAEATGGQWVEVANTDGEGLFIRFTPRASDTVRAWPEGTKLELVGPDTVADGIRWRNVRDPDGLVGWMPAQYLRPTTPD